MTPLQEIIAFIEKYPTLHGTDYLHYARSLEKEQKQADETYNSPAYKEFKRAEAQEQKATAPINLTELKLWVISERDRLEITGGIIDGFLTELCNKIDEVMVRPAAQPDNGRE